MERALETMHGSHWHTHHVLNGQLFGGSSANLTFGKKNSPKSGQLLFIFEQLFPQPFSFKSNKLREAPSSAHFSFLQLASLQRLISLPIFTFSSSGHQRAWTTFQERYTETLATAGPHWCNESLGQSVCGLVYLPMSRGSLSRPPAPMTAKLDRGWRWWRSPATPRNPRRPWPCWWLWWWCAGCCCSCNGAMGPRGRELSPADVKRRAASLERRRIDDHSTSGSSLNKRHSSSPTWFSTSCHGNTINAHVSNSAPKQFHLSVSADFDRFAFVPWVVQVHHTRKRQVFPVSIGPELNFVSLCFVEPIKSYLEIQSMRKTPPKALEDNPGGRIHWTGLASRRDSSDRRAKPQNLPLSFTEKTSKTLRHWRNAWFSLASFWGGVDHTPAIPRKHSVRKSYFNNNLPLLLANAMLSALLLFIKKNRASRNK